MDSDNLIRMANRIGDFFDAMPDRDEAMEGIVTHLKKFWDPRMRKQFLQLFDSQGESLHEIVREAVGKHRAMLA